MPSYIEHIDKIARDKGRNVLYICFDIKKIPNFDYDSFQPRTELMQWFEDNRITVAPSVGVADENCIKTYQGQLYVDVPFDENDPDYIKIRDHLENPDGSSRIPGVLFCYLPLETAMKNKHHDEPGFWDKWAENF